MAEGCHPVTSLAFGLVQCTESFRKIIVQFFLGYSQAIEHIKKLVIAEHTIGHDTWIFRVKCNRKTNILNEMG
jgi:hypothetical protein